MTALELKNYLEKYHYLANSKPSIIFPKFSKEKVWKIMMDEVDRYINRKEGWKKPFGDLEKNILVEFNEKISR